jgi:PAP2 superfamily
MTITAWLKALTEFGDFATLMPLAMVMLLWLLLMGSPRRAAWWAIAVVFCAGLTAVLKVFFYACPPTSHLHSPSGHTSFSTLIYGAMTLATATQSRGLPRMMAIGIGASLILGIAASRLLLVLHTAPEVGLGLVIGIADLLLFAQSYWRSSKTKVWLTVAGGALLAILHGRELDAERLFHEIAGYFRISCC